MYLTNEEAERANKWVHACIIRKLSRGMNISREDREGREVKENVDQRSERKRYR